MSTVTFQRAELALHELIRDESTAPGDPRNEATTRLQLIDRVLFECLGWDRQDCVAEERFGRTYTDYSLFSPIRALIVEAKREDNSFTLPAGHQDQPKVDIRFFQRHNRPAFDAVEQCTAYCQQRGTTIGAVSNGKQWIAFIASRSDGVPPLDGEALVFDSLDAIRRRFLIFWNSLSKPGVLSRGLASQLLTTGLAPAPEKLSRTIPNYPGFRNRNPLQTELQILSDLIIEDVARVPEHEADFIRECYSASGALGQYALVSRSILEARYSALFEQTLAGPSLAPATTKKGIDPEILAASLSRRPILLVGDIGVGKTMFIRHLIYVDARDVMGQAIVIYVDLGLSPMLISDIPAAIASDVELQLRDAHGIDINERSFIYGVYHGDLQRFERGLFGDLRESDPIAYRHKQLEFLQSKVLDLNSHLSAALEHLTKARRRQVVIFLDNVDQRAYEFQQEAFLAANGIAASWPATVFLAIRPETFHRSRSSGALGAYHPRAFTISPPSGSCRN